MVKYASSKRDTQPSEKINNHGAIHEKGNIDHEKSRYFGKS